METTGEGAGLCDDFCGNFSRELVCVEIFMWELFEKSSHTLKSFPEILFRDMRLDIFLRIPRSPKPGPNFRSKI